MGLEFLDIRIIPFENQINRIKVKPKRCQPLYKIGITTICIEVKDDQTIALKIRVLDIESK